MNILAKAILPRVFDHSNAADPRLPAARSVGSGLMNRIAAAGILRLALRWPAVSVILILSIVAARLISGRRSPADARHPAALFMKPESTGEWKPRH